MFTYIWDSFLLLSSQEGPKPKFAQLGHPLPVFLTFEVLFVNCPKYFWEKTGDMQISRNWKHYSLISL